MSGVSVVIHTCDEADFLRGCLKSVVWADEIVIIDMESRDESVAICREFTDRIFTHPRLPTADPARNFGLAQATGDWILVLDPDERASESLKETVKRIADDPASADGYIVPFTTLMFGNVINHSGWGNDEHIRLFRNGKCAWPGDVHKGPVIDGRVDRISKDDGHIVHHNYKDISQFIEKLNRYTSLEAERLYKEGRPFHPLKLFYQPGKEFYNRYIKLQGCRDGVVGLFLALMMSFYVQVSYIKLWEMRHSEAANAHPLPTLHKGVFTPRWRNRRPAIPLDKTSQSGLS